MNYKYIIVFNIQKSSQGNSLHFLFLTHFLLMSTFANLSLKFLF